MLSAGERQLIRKTQSSEDVIFVGRDIIECQDIIFCQ